jgi:hypothetical protein
VVYRHLGGMRIIKPAKTETFEHTITGLLAKRVDLFNEAIGLRDRLAEIKNDVAAIDRVLGTLGYKGDLEAQMPRQKREALFGRGDLRRTIIDALRNALRPLTTREIAEAAAAQAGQDLNDKVMMRDMGRRVSSALCVLKQDGSVLSSGERPHARWTLAPDTAGPLWDGA